MLNDTSVASRKRRQQFVCARGKPFQQTSSDYSHAWSPHIVYSFYALSGHFSMYMLCKVKWPVGATDTGVGLIRTQSYQKFSTVTPKCPKQHMTHMICWKFSQVPPLHMTQHMTHMICQRCSQVSPMHTTQHTTHKICRKFSPVSPLHTTHDMYDMLANRGDQKTQLKIIFSPVLPNEST